MKNGTETGERTYHQIAASNADGQTIGMATHLKKGGWLCTQIKDEEISGRGILPTEDAASAWLRKLGAEGNLRHSRVDVPVGTEPFIDPTTEKMVKVVAGEVVEIENEEAAEIEREMHETGEAANDEENQNMATKKKSTKSTTKKAAKPKVAKAPKAPKAPKVARAKSADGLQTFAMRVPATETEAYRATAKEKGMSTSKWARAILGKAAGVTISD